MKTFFAATLVIGATLSAAGAQAAEAEPWPSKPIRFVVGVTPGGVNDALARLFGKIIGDSTGQTVIVENRPGASGNIGAEHVMRSPPDGHTYYVPSSSIAIRPALYKKLSFNYITDFKPVALLAKVPNIISVHPSVPVSNLKELVDYSKAHPGTITYGSGSQGSSGHLAGESIRLATGADFRHVPYKGISGALNDTRAGHIKAIVDNLPSSLSHIRNGGLKPIAVTSSSRSPLLPDVPTVAESGIPGFEMVAWFGLIAPRETPQAIVDRMSAEVAKALRSDEVRAQFAREGEEAAPMTPKQFHDFIVNETQKWGDAVRKAGVTLE